MNDRVWYVYCSNQTYGPFTQQEVLSMLQEGRLSYTDYVFKEGFGNWTLIGNVSDFDRRVLNPGGAQPSVQAPAQSIPVTTSADTAAKSTEEVEQLWYLHDGKSQLGPFTKEYIKEGLDKKTVFWTFYVWREGMDNWSQIKDIHDFDRRRTPRDQVQVANFEITKNVTELEKKSGHEIPGQGTSPQAQQAQLQQGYAAQQQSSYQQMSIDEERDKLPVKAVIFLILFTSFLLGGVYSYPVIQDYITQYKANQFFQKGEKLIQQEKYEEGFDIMFEVLDKSPQTKAAQKAMNLLRAKEPVIKASLADESRRIKKLMDEFRVNYNVMPANARDINYAFPFMLDYFGKIFFKKDKNGAVSIIAKGVKIPVDGYVFTVSGDGKETENEIDKPQDFLVISQDYFELQKKGLKTEIKSKTPPDVKTEEKKPEAPVKAEPVKAEKPKKAHRARKEVKIKEPEVQEEEAEETQEEQNNEVDNTAQEQQETDNPPAPAPQPVVTPQIPRGDENLDSINKIIEDR